MFVVREMVLLFTQRYFIDSKSIPVCTQVTAENVKEFLTLFDLNWPNYIHWC